MVDLDGFEMSSGPFFFALNGGPTAWDASMLRWDRKILSFTLAQKEADFAVLTVTVKNPLVPPLAEPIWMWFTVTLDKGATFVPLMQGRLFAIPSGLESSKVTYEYHARPEDFVTQKNALADTLRNLPWWDPIWVSLDNQADPDQVLNGYTRVWDTDRKSLVVSTTDIVVGEEGTVAFGTGGRRVMYGSVNETSDRTAVTSVTCKGTANWAQSASGQMGVGSLILPGKVEPTLTSGSETGIAGHTGNSTGDQGGWQFTSFVTGNANSIDQIPKVSWSVSWQNRARTHFPGDTMSISESFSGPAGYNATSGLTLTESSALTIGDPVTGTAASASYSRTGIIEMKYSSQVAIGAKYVVNRKRTESVNFTLTSNLQPILHNPDEDSQMAATLNLTALDVGLAQGAYVLEPPIGNLSLNSFFTTERGHLALENLIMQSRAKLVAGGRLMKVSWDTTFAGAVDLSCRQNASIADPRVSGGLAVGKITGYTLSGDGSSGLFKGTVEISCCVGLDPINIGTGEWGTTTEVPGTADYIVDDYIDPDYYQRTSGSQTTTIVTFPVFLGMTGASDIGYTPPVYAVQPNDLSFPLSASNMVVSSTLTSSDDTTPEIGPGGVVTTSTNATATAPSDMFQTIQQKTAAAIQKNLQIQNSRKTTFTVVLKDITGAVDPVEYNVTTTVLQLPQQIDLE